MGPLRRFHRPLRGRLRRARPRRGFPRWLLFGVLLVSLAKDVYDEVRLRRGAPPLIYAGVEHAPSNVVLLVLLFAGALVPSGSFAGLSAWWWAVLLAAVDLVFDVSQDLRAYSR